MERRHISLKTIKSKKSFIDFEDLIDDELKKKTKCKKKKKKKNKKHNSSKKSSNKKKNKKKIPKKISLCDDFFGLNDEQINTMGKKSKTYSKTFMGRIMDSINIDAKLRVNITDESINNAVLVGSALLTRLLLKQQ